MVVGVAVADDAACVPLGEIVPEPVHVYVAEALAEGAEAVRETVDPEHTTLLLALAVNVGAVLLETESTTLAEAVQPVVLSVKTTVYV